jgi:hypothetical protein
VSHLARLQAEFGRKGLTVLGIDQDESRRDTLAYMAHVDAGFGYAVGIGSAAGYPNDGVPDAAVIGADGKVAYRGHPGNLTDNTLQRLLRQVRRPTPEEQESRAKSMLASAERLLDGKQFLRAELILRKTVASHGATEAGKRAAARLAEISSESCKAECDAQREIAALVGGVERPAATLAPKTKDQLARTLEAKAAAWKETAPGAAAIAREWAEIVAHPWK